MILLARTSVAFMLGAVSALLIIGCSNSAEPTAVPAPAEPTVTPTVLTISPTSTPIPTLAPTATSTPEPTATSLPTATATATAIPTPVPTAAPVPTAVATATPTPSPTSQPEPTATPIPASTVTPTPMPSPTSQPEPTATAFPTPIPPSLQITGVKVVLNSSDEGIVKGEIHASITNPYNGIARNPSLELLIDGETLEKWDTQADWSPGREDILVSYFELSPGTYEAKLLVDEETLAFNLDVIDPNISVKIQEIVSRDDGRQDVVFQLTNDGTVAPASITLSMPWLNEDNNPATRTFDWMPIGSRMISVQAEKPSDVVIPTSLPSLSAVAILNREDDIVYEARAEWITHELRVEPIRVAGFLDNGDAIAEFKYHVANRMLGETPSIAILAECPNEESSMHRCVAAMSDGISGFGSIEAIFHTVIPAGDREAVFNLEYIYPAGQDQGLAIGDRKIPSLPHAAATAFLRVPEAPDISVLKGARAEVSRYLPGATADIAVTVPIRAYKKDYGIRLSCTKDSEPVDGCNRDAIFQLPDDIEPQIAIFDLTLPIGSYLLSVDRGDAATETIELKVRDIIASIDPELWKCFSGDEANDVRDRLQGYGCAAWDTATIGKWDQSKPIRLWADGSDSYLNALRESLTELKPILNLQIEWVDDEKDADLVAHVGVSQAEWLQIGFSRACINAAGCADWKYDGPHIDSATIWIKEERSSYYQDMDLLEERIRYVIKHELIHVLVPMHHRAEPASIMNVTNNLGLPQLSAMDQALIRLHQNPAIEAGMTMKEVHQLIHVTDENESPHEIDSDQIGWQAFASLQNARAASFEIQGSDRGCDAPRYGWSDYGIGEFGRENATLKRFTYAENTYYVFYHGNKWEVWLDNGVRVMPSDANQLYAASGFWIFNDKHILRYLAALVYYPHLANLQILDRSESSVSIATELDSSFRFLNLPEDEKIKLTFTIDNESFRVLDYRWEHRRADTGCVAYEDGRNSAYGAETVELPPQIKIYLQLRGQLPSGR